MDVKNVVMVAYTVIFTKQCVNKNVSFEFRQCGTYFVKEGKKYKIQTKDLIRQAKLANIDFVGNE